MQFYVFKEEIEDAGNVFEFEWMNKEQHTEFFYNKARPACAYWENQQKKQTPPGKPFMLKRFNQDTIKVQKEIDKVDNNTE